MFKSLLVKLGHVIDRLLATESLSSKGSQHLRAFPTGMLVNLLGRLWERLKAWPVEPHWLEACGRRHKVMRIKFRAVQIKLTYVPAGSVGVSLELDVWAGRRYGYVSIGKRYSGHVWLRSGRL